LCVGPAHSMFTSNTLGALLSSGVNSVCLLRCFEWRFFPLGNRTHVRGLTILGNRGAPFDDLGRGNSLCVI
jgi:hypothetical protein